jgi:hypothetical protein
MSKPIFIIRLPGTWTPNQIDSSRSAIYKNKELTEDYHVMVLADREVESTVFEMYNSPNEPEKLENITKLIELSIERCLRQEEEQRKKEENE